MAIDQPPKEWQDDAARVVVGGLKQLADLLGDARVALDKANDAAKEAQATYDAVEAKMFDAMEGAALTSIRTERGLFRLNDLAWAAVEDEDKARAWAEENEPALLTLNRQRLSVIVRRVLTGDEPAPGLNPGILPPGVNFRTSRKISWRRS